MAHLSLRHFPLARIGQFLSGQSTQPFMTMADLRSGLDVG
jgi:hypothetical protein